MTARLSSFSAALALLAAAGTQAAPGTISAVVTTPGKGPVRVGEVIVVTVSISGYTDPVEIDGFNLALKFDGSVFQFVSDSIDFGDPSGPDQQWLSQPNQEFPGTGLGFTPFIDSSHPGHVAISVVDLGLSDLERGTLAPSGLLISFQLAAVAPGSSDILLEPYPDESVLFDTALTPAGRPALSGERKVKVKKSK